jgi:hypothetical protein
MCWLKSNLGGGHQRVASLVVYIESMGRVLSGAISTNQSPIQLDMGATRITKFSGIPNPGRTVSILVRASNKLVMEEADRSIHDAMCVIRCLVKEKCVSTRWCWIAPWFRPRRSVNTLNSMLVRQGGVCPWFDPRVGLGCAPWMRLCGQSLHVLNQLVRCLIADICIPGPSLREAVRRRSRCRPSWRRTRR